MRRALVVQQVAFEPAGTLPAILAASSVACETVHPYAGDPLPDALDAIDGVVLLGGPMAVYEQDAHPFLRDELRLIERALAAGVPILGVCLGSQLLAHVLGADVRPGGRVEMGWLPVTPAPAAEDDAMFNALRGALGGAPFVPFHQHGDVFDLPAGATALASSAMTPLQAFVARGAGGAPAYGLLFHAEVDATLVATMLTEFGDGAHAAGGDVDAMRHETPARLAALAPAAGALFTRWAQLLPHETRRP